MERERERQKETDRQTVNACFPNTAQANTQTFWQRNARKQSISWPFCSSNKYLVYATQTSYNHQHFKIPQLMHFMSSQSMPLTSCCLRLTSPGNCAQRIQQAGCKYAFLFPKRVLNSQYQQFVKCLKTWISSRPTYKKGGYSVSHFLQQNWYETSHNAGSFSVFGSPGIPSTKLCRLMSGFRRLQCTTFLLNV